MAHRTARFDPVRLAECRRRAGLSREQVAVRVGRSFASISFYERGMRPPDEILQRLAEALGCRPRDFLEPELEAAAL